MDAFFNFLSGHFLGILMLILIVLTINLSVNWYAKIFKWGKYKSPSPEISQENIGYVVAKFFANIIDDFRHFLALFLVIIFFSLLIFSMSQAETDAAIFGQKKEMLQLVLASLGGLLGSIIGYYFGESAASNKQIIQNQNNLPPGPPPSSADIQPIPTPPNLPS